MNVMGVDDQTEKKESRDTKKEEVSGKGEGKEGKDTVIFHHEFSHLRLRSPPSSPLSSPPVAPSSSPPPETSSRDHDILLESVREELEAIEGSERYDFSLRCWELIAGEAQTRKGEES